MKVIKFPYKGDTWHIYLIPQSEADEFLDDDGIAAEVQFDKKEIYINDKYLKRDVVLHELFHMATGYQYVQDSDLSFEQSEELFCNIFQYEGDALIALGNRIFENLTVLEASEDDDVILEIL